MRYLVGLSCEEYPQYGNISFCHSDLLLLSETLVEYCDYSREKMIFALFIWMRMRVCQIIGMIN